MIKLSIKAVRLILANNEAVTDAATIGDRATSSEQEGKVYVNTFKATKKLERYISKLEQNQKP